MKIFFILLVTAILPFATYGQKKTKNSNEGDVPRVGIYHVTKDSVQPLQTLFKNKENRIRVVLEGGMENVKNSVFVTSKNAEIRKDPSKPNEYIVIPQEEECEIIVDVKTFEVYYSIKEGDKNGKKVKQVLMEYPPKTYMLSYDRYAVK